MNQYSYAAADPVNNYDPFGLEIRCICSRKFREQIEALRSDSAFNADYERMEADSALYLIIEDPTTRDERVWGGYKLMPSRPWMNERFRVESEQSHVTETAVSRGVNRPVRGFIRIGVRDGAPSIACLLPHGMIHLKGLASGGFFQNLGHGHSDFSRPYFAANGCK